MKIEKVHIKQPNLNSIEINQREKVRLWGDVASICLIKPYNTDEKFFECLGSESEKHLR